MPGCAIASAWVVLRGLWNRRTRGTFVHENREASVMFGERRRPPDRAVQATSRTTAMHMPEESDEGVVPMTLGNEAAHAAEDPAEGRPETEGNPDGTTATGTPSPGQASSGLSRVREAAQKDKVGRNGTGIFFLISEWVHMNSIP